MAYSGSSYLADEVLEDLSPFQMVILVIPALTAHISFLLKSSKFGRLVLEHHLFKWQFHRFLLYCEGSYLQNKCWQIYPPSQLAISQIPALTVYILFFLWELNIWQAMAWHIYPSFKWQFHRFLLWLLIFHSYSRAQHLADQVLADLPPLQMAFSQIPALLWEFIFGRPSVGKSTPPFKRKFHRFLLWLPTVLSYCKSSTFGRPGLGRSNPLQMAVSQIPALLWEFIFGRPSVEKSTPI